MTQYLDKAPDAGRRSRKAADPSAVKVVEVLIVGAGFAGLGSAIQLRKAGITDIAIVERGTEVGGTWRDNQYPGAACDIPSNLYSFSFAQNPGWTRGYSGSREILAYIKGLARDHDLLPLIRFQHNVEALHFDGGEGVWTVTLTGREPIKARSVVMAQGPLSNAGFPNMRGIETFQGKKIHSARWDHSYDFAGKRVAVIGTGASAVQIIPELVKVADKVKVFQRTPGWVLPRFDFQSPEWTKALFAKLPVSQTAVREAMYWIHESMALGMIWNTPMTKALEILGNRFREAQVKDAWLRRQLTPDFKIGCKRVLMTNDYYPALQKPNCELISWPIANISEKGIRSVEGLEHQVDCIVFATGFEVSKNGTPFPVHGLGGRDLNAEWSGGAQAYKSVQVSGYPNLYFTFGPNSGPGHNSALVYMESQIDYIVRSIGRLAAGKLKYIDVRADAQKTYNVDIQKRLAKTNWNSGCKSWYLSADGFNSTMFPGFATQFAKQMATFRERDYRLV
ncbi:NAD(P)/FAD-dependent oxidoreductase [Nevskia sp.]|uniref:flavin-containing monooxygenase n=1 Tax=Nevskia sp. TaxID=1929292 RepID=UPI0025E7629D|nr:NAD(P)/FAD-dependent oxidoreductase [Nevskia sp.]